MWFIYDVAMGFYVKCMMQLDLLNDLLIYVFLLFLVFTLRTEIKYGQLISRASPLIVQLGPLQVAYS